MAQLLPLHHYLSLPIVSLLLLCYYFAACQEVLGIAVHVEEVEQPGETESPVDEHNLFRTADGRIIEMFPDPKSIHLEQWNNSSRRKLGDFLGCGFCKCCDAAQTYCESNLPCCYSINCNVQPFGFCKFVPVSCNCQSCGL